MHEKGTHMSRFLEVLHAMEEPLGYRSAHELMRRMLDRLDADSGSISLNMPYFALKHAPVSGVPSLMDALAAFDPQHFRPTG